jgi:hypothetical protein
MTLQKILDGFMRSKAGEIDVLTRYKMSSALASARKRSIPQPGQQPPLPGKTIGSAPTPVGKTSVGNPSTAPTGGNGQLTLAQIIDVYGRRILQLEKQVLEINPVSVSRGSVDPASLAKLVSEIVESKLAGSKFTETKSVDSKPAESEESIDSKIDARLKEFALKEIVPIVEELNARNEVLAREIVELKDLLLNLQSFTMTTHKKILDIALEPFEGIGSNEVGTTHGDNILDDVQEGVEENEVDEEHAAILAELEKSLLSIPEEYEMNPGISEATSKAISEAKSEAISEATSKAISEAKNEAISEAKNEATSESKTVAKDVAEHIVKTLSKSIEETTLETVPEETVV